MTHPQAEYDVRLPCEYYEQRAEAVGVALSQFNIDAVPLDRPDARQRALGIARQRCLGDVIDVYCGDGDVLFEALPSLGKTRGAIKAASRTGKRITIFVDRGHDEQYAQIEGWCVEDGVSYYRPPSFLLDCPTARGDHGDDLREKVRDRYQRNATPRDIHRFIELPCQQGGQCEYMAKWDFEPENYDVIVGHYTHAYLPRVTKSRIGVIDEFPESAYTETYKNPAPIVSHFLGQYSGPFEDYTELMAGRDDPGQNRHARNHIEAYHSIHEPDSSAVIGDSSGNAHADAPLLTYALLTMTDLGNGWEGSHLGGKTVVHNRRTDVIYVLSPPSLDEAEKIIALDGTPSWWLWNLVLGRVHTGEWLNHQRVLTDDERRRFIADVRDLSVIKTTNFAKTYTKERYVRPDEDGALLQAIEDRHGAKPALITSIRAKDQYDQKGILDRVSATEHYGNLKGSNRLGSRTLGIVIGSQHYGDDYIKKWGAFAGEAIERTGGRGMSLSYSGSGNEILRHMREHNVFQALMRFDRDGNGAVVYVHTAAIPEWVPLAGDPDDCAITTWTEYQRDIAEALRNLGSAGTTVVADHPSVSCSERYVRNTLHEIEERGYISQVDDGTGYTWIDQGLDEIELPITVELP